MTEEPARQHLITLHHILAQHFDEEELRTFCHELGVDYDSLPALGKSNKARELIRFLFRRRQLTRLTENGRRSRPDVSWPSVTSQDLEALPAELVDMEGELSLSVRVWAQQGQMARRERDLAVVPRETRAIFSIGERIVIGFQSTEDCFLTLINIGTSGRQNVLFPNVHDQDNYIRAGVAHWFPNPSQAFDFQLQGPPGLETIWAIATPFPTWRYGREMNDNLTAIQGTAFAEARCFIEVGEDEHSERSR